MPVLRTSTSYYHFAYKKNTQQRSAHFHDFCSQCISAIEGHPYEHNPFSRMPFIHAACFNRFLCGRSLLFFAIVPERRLCCTRSLIFTALHVPSRGLQSTSTGHLDAYNRSNQKPFIQVRSFTLWFCALSAIKVSLMFTSRRVSFIFFLQLNFQVGTVVYFLQAKPDNTEELFCLPDVVHLLKGWSYSLESSFLTADNTLYCFFIERSPSFYVGFFMLHLYCMTVNDALKPHLQIEKKPIKSFEKFNISYTTLFNLCQVQ